MCEIKKIINYQTHLELNDYTMGECRQLETRLSTWDKVYFCWVPKGYVYDKERKALLIPAGVSANWVSGLTNRPIEINYEPDEYEPMHMRIITQPKSKLQEESLRFLAGKGQYASYATYPQLVLNLDTGEGKTYITIAQLANKGLKALIIVNTEKIREQWIKSIIQYTDIDPKKICDFSGSQKCLSMIAWSHMYKHKAIFITNHATIHSFGENHGWDKVHKLFQAMHIGVKVYDEAHLNFANIVKIDCYTNTKITYYLTATFGRSDDAENMIYKQCFTSIPKYEQKKRTVYEGKPYITYLAIFYKSNPTIMQVAKMKNKYGFNRNAYCKYQITEDGMFFPIIRQLVQMTAVDKQYKTLLLVTTIDGIEDMYDYLHREFPDLSIGKYHSKIDPAEKDKAIECRLIISTAKSLGVGADIHGLKALINTESYKSTIITEQIIGRLRKPEDGSGCIYIETIDKDFNTLRSQQRVREKFLRKMVSRIKYVKM